MSDRGGMDHNGRGYTTSCTADALKHLAVAVQITSGQAQSEIIQAMRDLVIVIEQCRQSFEAENIARKELQQTGEQGA